MTLGCSASLGLLEILVKLKIALRLEGTALYSSLSRWPSFLHLDHLALHIMDSSILGRNMAPFREIRDGTYKEVGGPDMGPHTTHMWSIMTKNIVCVAWEYGKNHFPSTSPPSVSTMRPRTCCPSHLPIC